MKLIFKTTGVYAKAETPEDLSVLLDICKQLPKAKVKGVKNTECLKCGRRFNGTHGLHIHAKVMHSPADLF